MESNNHILYDYFNNREFIFPDWVLSSYCLALQTKPFVILTGISGTGKTKIAQIFADYVIQEFNEKTKQLEELDDDKKTNRITFVSVRPDWMDKHGLLGYFNPITEKYQTTPVLRLLLSARDNPNKPHFVILDEMNLAKVEYYFSDFLSVMESRTPDKPEGEALSLHDNGEDVQAEGESTLRIPSRLIIPNNVFFAGTVNVDESTYMFSPKVLDRANVIEFNEVDLPGYDTGDGNNVAFMLKEPDVRALFQGKQHRVHCSKADFDAYRGLLGEKPDLLAELYRLLRPHHLHFGYRVINEISRFVVLASEQIENFDLNTALDIQFLQKVLPKLHGNKSTLREPLTAVFRFCYETQGDTKPGGATQADAKPTDAELQQAMAFDRANACRFPRTAQKVARMLVDLERQGYTSFIQ